MKSQENKIEITGRLSREPRLSPTDAGRPVCDLLLSAHNGRYPSFDIDVSVFDAVAESCAESFSKGEEVRVTGELRFRRWRDRQGRWREGFSIAGRVESLVDDRPRADAEPPGRPETVGAAAAGRSLAAVSGTTRNDPRARTDGPSFDADACRQGRYGDPYA